MVRDNTESAHNVFVVFVGPGDNVGLNIKGLDKNNMLRAGDVMVYEKDIASGQTRDWFRAPRSCSVPYTW